MRKLKQYQIAVVMVLMTLSTLLLTSCQNEQSPVESQDSQNSTFPNLGKFALPEGATFVSATFNVNILVATNQNINVHRITSPWEELVVTWNNFGGSYSPTIEATFNASTTGWTSVDVTSLVGSWLNGTNTNYGLLLDQVNVTYPRTEYDTREYDFSANASYLEICYTLNGEVLCDTTRSIGDTYIYQSSPDENNGYKGEMYSGWGDEWDMEKQALIQFDLEYTSSNQGECTRIPLYWQWHTQYGPGPRDTNWDLIQTNGENSAFFLSGKSYYQVLKQPAWFNDYYSLARQYIATKLNVLSGTSIPSEIQTAYDNATVLLSTYTPAQVNGLNFWHPIRMQFRSTDFKLLKYNWGIVGPGRCHDCGD
jgi:hypothetical protein